MKLFKRAQYYSKPITDDELRTIAIDIVDKLAHRWPWEEPHNPAIEYVLTVLRSIRNERN